MKQRSLFKRIGNWVVNTFLILLVCISILMITTKIRTGKANLFGYRPFVVVSESMLPNYKVGTLLIAKTTEEYEIGRVYAYKNAIGMTIVHRLIDITEDGYIFKGDNNTLADTPVDKANIQYEIIFAVNKGE